MKRYRTIAVEDAREGMRLHENIRDCEEDVSVVDHTVTEAQPTVELELAMARIAYLFRHAGSGPANAILRAVVEVHRMETLA